MSSLQKLWLSAPEGKLCAREQAKAWALREVRLAEGGTEYGLYPFVASRVQKNMNGKPTGGSPTVPSIADFFAKVDSDPE